MYNLDQFTHKQIKYNSVTKYLFSFVLKRSASSEERFVGVSISGLLYSTDIDHIHKFGVCVGS